MYVCRHAVRASTWMDKSPRRHLVLDGLVLRDSGDLNGWPTRDGSQKDNIRRRAVPDGQRSNMPTGRNYIFGVVGHGRVTNLPLLMIIGYYSRPNCAGVVITFMGRI